jgi:hypothetical protein
LVRFNPRDAVSVPQDAECQKLRVCKYEVLEEIECDNSEIKEPYYGVYTNGFGQDNKDNDYDEDYDDEEYEDEE